MNCNNIRKYFYAFLDNELDTERNIEILSHLDMCHECSQRIEMERQIQESVKETVCKIKAPTYLTQKILKRIERKPGIFTSFKDAFLLKRWLIPLGAVTTAIILIVSFIMIQHKAKKDNIFYLTESIYHDYMMKKLEPDILSQDPGSIINYIRGKTGLDITLPYINEGARPIGAASVRILDEDVPTVFYMLNDVAATLFIINNHNIDFSRMDKIKGELYGIASFCGLCQIIGWKEANSQYIMVSMLNREKLIGGLLAGIIEDLNEKKVQPTKTTAGIAGI